MFENRCPLDEMIDQLLFSRNETARDFCRRLGVSQSAINHWKSGTSKPSRDNVAKLAKVLRAKKKVPLLIHFRTRREDAQGQ